MKRLLKILLIWTGIFTVLNLIFQVSFSIDIIDTILLVTFGLSGTTYMIYLLPVNWIKALSVIAMAVMIVICWFIWQLFGYKSRIDRTWENNNYSIQLEHRLEIAGPGCYWFLVNRKLMGGVMEKRIETRRYQSGLPDPPEKFEFMTSGDTLTIECCESNVVMLPDSMSYDEKLEYLRQKDQTLSNKKPSNDIRIK